MAEWNQLANDFKMCVVIYREAQAGRLLWFTRLSELLKDDMTRHELSMLEDKLQDIGVLYKKYEEVDGINSCCYFIVGEAQNLIKNISENLTNAPAIFKEGEPNVRGI